MTTDSTTRSRHAPPDIGNAIRIGAGIAVAAFLGFYFIVRPLVFGATVEQRIEKTRNPTRLAAFIVDDGIERRLQRLAALKLAEVLLQRTDARDRAEAAIAAARDAARDGERRTVLRQDLSLVAHDALLAHESDIRDRAAAIVGRGEGDDAFRNTAQFAPLTQAEPVDLLVDLKTVENELRFTHHLEDRDYYADYASSSFFGMTHAEMDALAASARTVALVHREDAIVGFVSGQCNGHALREDADVYIVSLDDHRVVSAGESRGIGPPAGSFQSFGSAVCDVSGGPAPIGDLVRQPGRD